MTHVASAEWRPDYGEGTREFGQTVLRALSHRRSLRMLLDLAACYAVIGVAFFLLVTGDSWWVYIISFVLIGNRQYALSILAHDGRHGQLFQQRTANDRFALVALCAPLGLGFHGMRRSHLAHHRHLGTDADLARPIYLVGNKATRARFLLFLTGLTTLPRAPLNAARLQSTASPRGSAVRLLADRWLALVAQLIIGLVLTLTLGWWYYFAFWVAPLYVLLLVPHRIRMFCEHAVPALPDTSSKVNRLVTYLPHPLERILLAPMNTNFHAEHHLWPGVPYANLPHLHPHAARRDDVQVRRSYVGFLWQYYRQLPLSQGSR